MSFLMRRKTLWRWEDDGENRYITFYNPGTSGIHLFNPVASLIFYYCDGKHSEDDIGDILKTRFSRVDPDRIRNDVKQFVHFLIQGKLVNRIEK